MGRIAISVTLGAVTALLPTAPAGVAPATSAQAGATEAATLTVRMGDYFFRPGRLIAHVGDRVRFINVGRIQHTVADTDQNGHIRSLLIRPRPLSHGQSQIIHLTRRGTIHYLCTFHPSLMRGVIVVR